MNVREIEAKTLLSSSRQPDPWFGIKYTMNLYRGCQHRCIYCDSRSECYGIEDFDGEVLVKANALDLLRRELRSKRVKGYVGTGSMNDPYMPLEREVAFDRPRAGDHRRAALPGPRADQERPGAARYRTAGRHRARQPAGCHRAPVVSFTVTTTDDDLARKLEPGAPPPSARFRRWLRSLREASRTGVMLMPVLPFIEDNPENVRQIVEQAHARGARHVVAGFRHDVARPATRPLLSAAGSSLSRPAGTLRARVRRALFCGRGQRADATRSDLLRVGRPLRPGACGSALPGRRSQATAVALRTRKHYEHLL